MKVKNLRESFYSLLSGIFFGTFLTFASLSSLATAFAWHLPAVGNSFYRALDLTILFRYCVCFSLLFSLCFTIRRMWILVPIVILGYLGYGWHFGNLRECTFDFLYIISKRYDNAYGCGVLLLNEFRPIYSNIAIVFHSFALLGSAIVAWATCKKQSSYWILVYSLLCLVPFCVITNTVAEKWCLFLWIFTVVQFMITNHTRRKCFESSIVLIVYCTVPLLIGITLLFTFVPKDTYQGQGRADALLDRFEDIFQASDSSFGGGGLHTQSTVDLSTLGDRKERNIPVMYLTVPESGTYYLRGEVYSKYNGTQWIADEKMPKLPWRIGTATDKQISIRTRFEHDMLYVPYCVDPTILSEGDRLLPNPDRLKEYSYIFYQEGTALSESITPSLMTAMTDLPYDTFLWVNDFISQSLSQTDSRPTFFTDEQVVSFIEDLVRSSAVYDLSPAQMDPSYKDFVQWFMEEGESGYCVHFAASAAVLLRANAIPARYVRGYVVEAQANRETTVYQKQSHAWVEYWTANNGWQILDATPAGEEEPEPTTTMTEESTVPSTSATEEEPTVTEPPTEPTTEEQTTPLPDDDSESGNALFLWNFLKWLLVLGLPIALFLGQRKVRLILWDRKLAKASKKEQALLLWNRSLKFSKILNQKPHHKLKRIAERAKFSQHEITTSELEIFHAFFRESAATLKKRSIFKRFYARWVLALV